MGTVKRALIWLGIAFVAYTIFTAPDQAADMVQSGVDGISTAASSLGDFFDALV